VKWATIEDNGSMSAAPLGPEKPWRCVDGYESHEWMLAIEEGRVVLHTDCNLCCSGIADWGADDDMVFQMEPIAVRLAVESDPGNPPYGIDPYCWIDLTPVSNPEVSDA
jgi:hypothetical protein